MAERNGPMEAKMLVLNTHKLNIQRGMNCQNNSDYNYNTAKCNVGVKGGGKWFYEVTVKTNSQMLLGWVTHDYNKPPDPNQGIGFDPESWSFDGYNSYKYHAGVSSQFGSTYYTVGDIYGFGLDIDSKKIIVWKNGQLLGELFDNIPQNKFLYPACSLKRYQQVEYNFGATPFKFAQNDYLALHSFLSEKQKQDLEKVFEKYKSTGIKLSESGEDYGDFIKPEGVFELAKDIGAVGSYDPVMLVVSWKIGCARAWEIDRKEWMTLSLYGICETNKLTSEAAKWKKEVFSDNNKFKPFYRFIFDYLSEKKNTLPIEMCREVWKMISYDNKKWILWDKFNTYLDQTKKKLLTKDDWAQLQNFMIKYPIDLDKFDENDPWPVLFEEFVDFVQNGAPESGSDDDDDDI
eukprot:TRINITY_DN111_c0_g2_i1.p1 TRINITY_DN111_c0_g2~~TRINITY_DN111_c0_g2_i1.p1  ORF type:complete len:404 (-),score=118.35 TRINITY_DN111_c0_g2_i1:89-1300(-)